MKNSREKEYRRSVYPLSMSFSSDLFSGSPIIIRSSILVWTYPWEETLRMLHKPPPLFVFSRLPAVSILILRVLVFLSFFLNLVTTALHRFVSKKMRTRSCVISFRHLGKLSTKFLSVSVGLPRISSSNQF